MEKLQDMRKKCVTKEKLSAYLNNEGRSTFGEEGGLL